MGLALLLVVVPLGPHTAGTASTAIPEDCNGDYVLVPATEGLREIPFFTDDCYHMRTDLNRLDTPHIDVLIVPPASMYPERDLRVMRQAVEMWAEGIHQLAPQMGLDWLSENVTFDIFIDDDVISTDPLWDPEIVVVATNPAGGIGIGIDPLDIFGKDGPCHGQPNPLASLEAWNEIPGYDSHHDGKSGTYSAECEGGGPICFAVNGAIDPAPGIFDFFGLFDLVAHEVGHCLTIGHVGDAGDHKANAVPETDIMAYRDQSFRKCVSTLDVEGFALTMSKYLLPEPIVANDANSTARGSFQIQHPDNHFYASPTGRAEDCPQPDTGIVPGYDPSHDAGSGRDAPSGTKGALPIHPDTVYTGSSPFSFFDPSDVYHINGTAGQVFQGWADGHTGCYHLLDAAGDEFDDRGCSYAGVPSLNTGPLVIELPYTGDYYFKVVNWGPPPQYKFAYSLDGAPPGVGPLD